SAPPRNTPEPAPATPPTRPPPPPCPPQSEHDATHRYARRSRRRASNARGHPTPPLSSFRPRPDPPSVTWGQPEPVSGQTNPRSVTGGSGLLCTRGCSAAIGSSARLPPHLPRRQDRARGLRRRLVRVRIPSPAEEPCYVIVVSW